MTEPNQEAVDLTRPIIGLWNRTPQEVFDIMCDRIRRRTASAQSTSGDVERVLREAAQQMVDAWAASNADGMEAAEANLRCALAGEPLTYALGDHRHD